MLDANKSYFSDNDFERIDFEFQAALAKTTNGVSLLDYYLASLDWSTHLAVAPGTALKLSQSAIQKAIDLARYGMTSFANKDAVGPASKLEPRLSGEAWKTWPFNVFAQVHQSTKDWWLEASNSVEGVTPEHRELMHAASSGMLDLISPANFPLTNPEVLQKTWDEKGKNIVRGIKYLIEDKKRDAGNNGIKENDDFVVGKNIAITQGKVVYQNELLELIQYSPTTKQVASEPVLICPAWIMKYYILDLSERNSLAKFLVEQGKTVFMISWKNPEASDRDVGFEDYVDTGLMSAIQAVSEICPNNKINAVGYCIGGTLLSVAAAAMARDDDERLNSITLLAAQVDFTEAGEIRRFISPGQLSMLNSLMWKKGFLDSGNMGGAFSALRSSDLIYGAMVDRYLKGNEPPKIDIMAWNADGTRMPYRMHSEYLHRLYLENQLATNKFKVGGRTISLSDIRVPLFIVGTETDHVAPWKSVYKFHQHARSDLTFLLTSGGHNAGIVSGREHPRRRYRVHTQKVTDRYQDPETWLESTKINAGSWWMEWDRWLDQRMSGKRTPPKLGNKAKGYAATIPAPGSYVFG